MLLGMGYDEFWECEPERYAAYYKLHELRIERDNQQLWLAGAYTYKAVQAALEEFGYGLGGAKGPKPNGYMKDVLPVTAKQAKEAEERKKKDTWDWVMKGQE